MGFGTVYPSVNDASAFLGRAQSVGPHGDGRERRGEGEEVQRRWRW